MRRPVSCSASSFLLLVQLLRQNLMANRALATSFPAHNLPYNFLVASPSSAHCARRRVSEANRAGDRPPTATVLDFFGSLISYYFYWILEKGGLTKQDGCGIVSPSRLAITNRRALPSAERAVPYRQRSAARSGCPVRLCVLQGRGAADWQAAFDMVKASPAVPLRLAFFPLVSPGSADVFYSQGVSEN